MVISVTDDLGASAAAFGVVLSISGAGGVLGGALAPVADRKLGFSYVLPVGVALAGPLLLLMIASNNLVLLAGCLFFNSFFGIMVSVLVASLRQKIAPRELAGRVASVQAFIAMGIAMPGGALLGGVTAELLGVRSVFILSGALCLLLVGPTPDGSESQATLTQIVERCSLLPDSVASRIHVAAVSMEDREVNATVVNAVQRVSSVVTQRSLIEAFGLTVAEAMWKKAPVVASAVGGIRDQIDDGVDGVLVDPADGTAWAEAVRDLLLFPERAREMGLAAHESVRREFLSNRHLQDLLQIVADLVG